MRSRTFTSALIVAGLVAAAWATVAGQGRGEAPALTKAQQKLTSHLLSEIWRKAGKAAERGVLPGPTGVKVDKDGRAYVDIRAEVTDELVKTVEDTGAKVTATSKVYRSIVAWVPLLKIESLAGDERILSIVPVPDPIIG